jgi:hypothetical protein
MVEKKVKNIERFDTIDKIENKKTDITSTEQDLLNIVNGFNKR